MSHMKGDLLTKTRKLVKYLAKAEPHWLKSMEHYGSSPNEKLQAICLPRDKYLLHSNHNEEYVIRQLNPVNWTFKGETSQANVIVVSVDQKLEILGSRKVKLVADMLLNEAENISYDLIVLLGGLDGAEAFAACEKLVNMLKKQRDSGLRYGAICASPALVLEPNGLLKGKKATALPAM